MKEVWFFLIRTNTDYIKRSPTYDSLEEAYEARQKWHLTSWFEEPITPVMKGYEKE
jgi:hypothetical protein